MSSVMVRRGVVVETPDFTALTKVTACQGGLAEQDEDSDFSDIRPGATTTTVVRRP